MLGSPGGRRRRLIQAFAPKNDANVTNDEYASVPSFSSSSSSSLRRRRRRNNDAPGVGGGGGDPRKQRHGSGGGGGGGGARTLSPYDVPAGGGGRGFMPIDPNAEHGYRINVSRDGSMITAVPIDEPRGGLGLGLGGGGVGGEAVVGRFNPPSSRPTPPPRASPIMFGQPRSSPTEEGSIASSSWPTRGLLDARGKQRHKMRRTRPVVVGASRPQKSHNSDPFGVVHAARDKLKHAKGLLAFAGTNNDNNNDNGDSATERQRQPRSGDEPPIPQSPPPQDSYTRTRKTKVSWDLSPKRMHPRATTKFVDTGINNSEDANSFGSFPILSPNHKFDDGASSNGHEKDKKREGVEEEGTGEVTAKTDNADSKEGGDNDDDDADESKDNDVLLRLRVAEIQSQQDELARNIAKKALIKGTLITAIDGNLERNRRQMASLSEELRRIQLRTTRRRRDDGDDARGRNEVPDDDDDDDDDAVAPQYGKSPSGAYDRLASYDDAEDPGITADTDSVADLYRREESGRRRATTATIGLDPPARRSSSPAIGGGGETRDRPPRAEAARRMEPYGSRISAVSRDGDENRGTDDYGGMLYADGRNDMPGRTRASYPRTMASTRQNAFPTSESPQLQHFRHQQYYEQPRQERHPSQNKAPKRGKLVRFDSPSEADSEELKFENYYNDSPSVNGTDVISYEEEHFNVDPYAEDFGSFVSSDRRDTHQWSSNQHRVALLEKHSGDSRHRLRHQHDGEKKWSSILNNHNNYNTGVSSDSVETDRDLGFIHAVAAVVIQTAVRRFLAEIAAVERQYAVRVIQTAICNWMARERNPLYIPSLTNEFQRNSDGIFYDVRGSVSRNIGPLRRTKRVMFEDDYNDFRDFAATEIQRCYRGWWARAGLEVEHFAATVIQRAFRGWWAREGLDVDRYCAVEIQRIIRGYLARMTYVYDMYCIIVVQSVIRRHLSFHTSAVRLASILYIQAIYRGYRVRADLKRYVRNGQEVAATFIQAQWRSYDAQMHYINTLADILIAQSMARRWLTIKKIRRMIEIQPRHEKIRHDKQRKNPHAVWQQHRLNVVAKPLSPERKNDSLAGFDVFAQDTIGEEEWYDGNKSETSDMLKKWRRRSPK
ncbi:hypothetical protein ACHAW5_003189 [Stephanodiscus triporus]|uniref:Uncharacterized protein n=1 Tax=Stephanodiscus triporus TaxID=2934178 RepID=A0ABD3MDZ1_9STRA